MSAPITRGQLLSRSAKGGAALLVAGTALGRFVDSAAAAPLPTGDLAYARLLVGAELLASDFYQQAIAASNSGRAIARYLKRAYLNEQEHYQSVAGILSGAGLTLPPCPATSTSATRPARSTARGRSSSSPQQLEATMLGTYLGAIGGIQTNIVQDRPRADRRLRGAARRLLHRR